MNPNSSVNSVMAIPAQAITPRSSRKGLIGRCSATSGLGIRLSLIQKLAPRASFHSGERTPLACWRSHSAIANFCWPSFHCLRVLIKEKFVAAECGDQHATSVHSPEVFLTQCVYTSTLSDEHEKHGLVSDPRFCDVHLHGSNRISNAARSRQAGADFSLTTGDGSQVSLKDYRGKWVVLYFYPKDFTSGCTLEAHNFQRDITKYGDAGAVILGVSVDTAQSHKDFCAKEGLQLQIARRPRRESLYRCTVR